LQLGRVVRGRIVLPRDPVVDSHEADATFAGDLAPRDPTGLTDSLDLVRLQDEHGFPFWLAPSFEVA